MSRQDGFLFSKTMAWKLTQPSGHWLKKKKKVDSKTRSNLMGSVWSFLSFCSSGGIPFHLKNRSHPNPPRWSALADPWYANVSAFSTSIAGHTTLERDSAIRANKGSTQPGVASQWESRNVRTSPLAALAPFRRARTSPSRLVFLITVTLLMVATWSSKGLPSLSIGKDQQFTWLLIVRIIVRSHSFSWLCM